MSLKPIARYGVALLLLFLIAVFFIKEFQAHWLDIRFYEPTLRAWFVFMSFAATTASYLLITYSWFVALNALSRGGKISLAESVAAVNASNLTKYIPGKVWSYAMQILLLSKAGYSKSLILYVNLLVTYVSLMTFMMLGLCFLPFARTDLPPAVVASLLAGLVLFDLLFLRFSAQIARKAIAVINKIFQRDLRFFETSARLFVLLHGISLVAGICLGMGGYFLCLGVGFDVNGSEILSVMSAVLIADVIGFVAVVAPGGLGVREGVMYLILSGVSAKALPLILPIAARIVTMIVDVFLGAIGLSRLRKMKATRE